ncbi:hypothetical protein IBB73_03695 [Listeria seeligeri]|uniref:hypothetical protein n=1 Tax=Listeria seeligeri TaxID=1640 RepID=UPI00188760C1|nr:hypothetical protein [Listeria seeligeri]MBF2654883.1 hypothetical protein [Listeria seeligeri]
MFNKWIEIYSSIVDNPQNVENLTCPNCKKKGTIDYYFIPYTPNNNLGSVYIWCAACKKGIYLDRVGIPVNAKKIVDESINLNDVIPAFTKITPD